MGGYHLFGIIVLLIVTFPENEANVNEAKSSESKDKVYIVYMGGLSVAGRRVHAQLQTELMKRKKNPILHTYSKNFMGFAVRLSDEEAKSIARRHGVVTVIPDKVSHLHTTRSWDFLMMSQNAAFKTDDSIITSPSSSNGADTTYYHLHPRYSLYISGISPEHPSFIDKHMGPIPTHWNGTCMSGENSTYSFKCNRKVIGARYYDDPEKPGYITTPLDLDGHGTHVASIAAGRHVLGGASYNGLARGIPRGGSPESRIAVYCVCGADGECPGSGILKAFDDAIADGVDALSVSLGGIDQDLLTDAIAIEAFHAVEKGVIVVASAGNDGPSPGIISSIAPWILTVGATTIDRDFQADIVLGGGNKKIIIKGGGINFSGLDKSAVYPLVDGLSAGSNKHDVANASHCIPGSLDGRKVKGKIVLCENKGIYYVDEKFNWLKKKGAIGMILINNYLRQLALDYGTSPIATVAEGDGALIRSYISSTRNPLATILPTVMVLNDKPAPVAAFFSSRGPGIKNLLKPDIAAPGVDILGAWRLDDTSLAIPGEKQPIFNILSGTSQSCPHVSGLAATIKSRHPKWSPSAIKSAIMTTAIQTNNIHDPITAETGSRATSYDIGAGEISLFGPLCPGLVYETETIDYIRLLCNLGYNTSAVKSISSTVPPNFSCPSKPSPDLVSDMNYPSIVVSGLKSNEGKTVKRTVTNVGEEYSTYRVSVEAPAGMHVQVVPNMLQFTKNVKKLGFQVSFVLATTSKETLFGSITWSNSKYIVRSPFVVNNA